MDKDLLAKEGTREGFDFSIIEKLPPDQLLQFVRDGMGGYNVNICTEEVRAKFEMLAAMALIRSALRLSLWLMPVQKDMPGVMTCFYRRHWHPLPG
jgi:hypothetical protein